MDRRFGLAVLFATLIIVVLVGTAAYGAGVSHGLAIAAAPSGPPEAAFGRYGWYRPWGFGFFGPFVTVLLVFLLFRVLFRGGLHRRGWYYWERYGVPPRFEEWHRRMHERMDGEQAADAPNKV